MKLIITSFYILFIQLVSLNAYAFNQESLFDTSSLSVFNQEEEFLPVEKAFSIDFYQQDTVLDINIHIEPGYYLYRKQFKFTGDNLKFSPVDLPEGKHHEDEFFGVQQIYQDQISFKIKLTSAQPNASINIRYQGCAEKGLCYPPTQKKIMINAFVDNALVVEKNQVSSNQKSEQHQLADMLKNKSLALTLLAFFVGGLLLSFTPCVFPMYPILTGIIVGQGDKLTSQKAFRLSFVYVQGMAITYTMLGIVVALAGAQFQAMFQHPVILILLSVLFIFLALSMFGVFNLALPQAWQNKLNNISNKQKGGSYYGVLMMGALSGLVASPCTTAPLTGALLYISHSGDLFLGASALYALSLGMGLPLLIIGSSGGKLLPKAGGWMNVIKNIFGLLLLSVPIFLLERFINQDVISLLWSLLLLAAGGYFYFLNQQAFNNRSHTSNISPFGYGFRSVVIFLILFVGAQKAYQTLFSHQNYEQKTSQAIAFKQINNVVQLQKEIAQASLNDQKVMVDLYADWCVACKEFEEFTFSDPLVKEALQDILLLQVDLTQSSSKESIELMKKYQVFGLPSILFFNEKGEELVEQRVTGFMKAPAFKAHIQNL